MADIPKTPNILKIFEPITLPIAISDSFFNAAITEDVNSGILVPIETTVIAIIRSLTPKFLATFTAPLTNNSDPNQRAAPPKNKNKNSFNNVCSLVVSFGNSTIIFLWFYIVYNG